MNAEVIGQKGCGQNGRPMDNMVCPVRVLHDAYTCIMQYTCNFN